MGIGVDWEGRMKATCALIEHAEIEVDQSVRGREEGKETNQYWVIQWHAADTCVCLPAQQYVIFHSHSVSYVWHFLLEDVQWLWFYAWSYWYVNFVSDGKICMLFVTFCANLWGWSSLDLNNDVLHLQHYSFTCCRISCTCTMLPCAVPGEKVCISINFPLKVACTMFSVLCHILQSKIWLTRSLVTSIFLYAWESWTLTAELPRRIQALEKRRYRKILRISYKDHVTNEGGSPCQHRLLRGNKLRPMRNGWQLWTRQARL